jgi:pimeloyl-ACP methyl ester carboxylesterase
MSLKGLGIGPLEGDEVRATAISPPDRPRPPTQEDPSNARAPSLPPPDATPVQSRRRRVHGVELHWVEAGEGAPVVLLHGLGGSHQTWLPIMEALARDRRVLAVDLAGHGLSERPDASYTLDWHAELVGRWIDAVGLDRFDLVGHSYGGGVAEVLMTTHGQRIAHMALVAPGGFGREVFAGLRLLALPIGLRAMQPFMSLGTQVGIAVIGDDAFSAAERRWQAFANGLPNTARAIVRTSRGVIGLEGQRVSIMDYVDRVATLPPIRLYWGDRDPIVPWQHGLDAVRRFRHLELVHFPFAGHFLHQAEPDRFSAELRAFFGDADVPGAQVRTRRHPRPRRLHRAGGRICAHTVAAEPTPDSAPPPRS